jgi:hypothetical protein
MAGVHVFQAVQHPELDKLGPVTIHDFLQKRARYLRLVSQRADGVNVTPITVVCYELLRMRTLSISYAKDFRMISCGEVEYDRSSQRND